VMRVAVAVADLQSDCRWQEESWGLSSRTGPEKLLFS
jgi:hypothetical protein